MAIKLLFPFVLPEEKYLVDQVVGDMQVSRTGTGGYQFLPLFRHAYIYIYMCSANLFLTCL